MINSNNKEQEIKTSKENLWLVCESTESWKSNTNSILRKSNSSSQKSAKTQTAKIIKVKVDNWEVTVTNQDK